MRNVARSLVAALATCFVVACGEVRSGPANNPAAPTPASSSEISANSGPNAGKLVVANLSLNRAEVANEADLEVHVVIENRSAEPLSFTEEEFTSPHVLFEVRDALGEKVLAGPPPTPTGRHRRVEPGKQADIKMTLAGMFSPPLKPGAYNIRLRRISSTPHAFKIVR